MAKYTDKDGEREICLIRISQTNNNKNIYCKKYSRTHPFSVYKKRIGDKDKTLTVEEIRTE
jgi:hypothetical protein